MCVVGGWCKQPHWTRARLWDGGEAADLCCIGKAVHRRLNQPSTHTHSAPYKVDHIRSYIMIRMVVDQDWNQPHKSVGRHAQIREQETRHNARPCSCCFWAQALCRLPPEVLLRHCRTAGCGICARTSWGSHPAFRIGLLFVFRLGNNIYVVIFWWKYPPWQSLSPTIIPADMLICSSNCFRVPVCLVSGPESGWLVWVYVGLQTCGALAHQCTAG